MDGYLQLINKWHIPIQVVGSSCTEVTTDVLHVPICHHDNYFNHHYHHRHRLLVESTGGNAHHHL